MAHVPQDVQLPGDYTDPRTYVADLLFVAFPDAYAFEGTEEDDVEMYLSRPDGIRLLHRYVADAPDADIPNWLRDKLRADSTTRAHQ